MVTKDHTYFNKPATKNLQVCLSIYDISLPPGTKGFSILYFFSLRILSELSIPTFIFGLTFCFYCPSDLFQKIAVEARLTVSWTEQLLRYFYHIFTLKVQSCKLYNKKIYDNFKKNNRHSSFCIHSCCSFQLIEL